MGFVRLGFMAGAVSDCLTRAPCPHRTGMVRPVVYQGRGSVRGQPVNAAWEYSACLGANGLRVVR
jgi:hypothetical protein